VNAKSELEGHLQIQASSPAQDIRATEGEQLGLAHVEQLRQASRGGQDIDEQLDGHWSKQFSTVAGEVNPSPQEPQVELRLERLPIGGEQTEDHNDEQQSKVTAGGEQFENLGGEQVGGEQIEVQEGEQIGGEQLRGEQVERQRGEQTRGKQMEDQATTSRSDKQIPDEQYSQWLKSVMPDASNGWWDVRVKRDRFTVKFRWRGPDLQVIPLLHISREEIEILKQSSHKDVQRRIQDQIVANLRSFSLNSAKRDKAVTAAEKLGIRVENFQLRKIEN
jgi:hypothetical protein